MKRRKLRIVILSAAFLFPFIGTATWFWKSWPRVTMKRLDAGADGASQPEKARAEAVYRRTANGADG